MDQIMLIEIRNFGRQAKECCVVPPWTKASERCALFHQLVKKNATQSTDASWDPWASSVAGAWGTLEVIVRKMIDLSALRCKIKVSGAIRDTWPLTDPYEISPTIKLFQWHLVCHALLSITLRFVAVRHQWERLIAAQIEDKPEKIPETRLCFGRNRKPNATPCKIQIFRALVLALLDFIRLMSTIINYEHTVFVYISS